MDYKLNKEKNSSIEIEVTIKNANFIKNWDKAFKIMQKEVEIDGFRKGMAPESAIVSKHGESAILQEMANIAINESYPEIIIKEKIHVIEEPHIHIIDLTKEKDFIYHAHVTIYPTFDLGDHKEQASSVIEEDKKNIKNTEVPEDELKTILEKLSDEVKNSTPNIENLIRENYKLETEMVNKNNLRSKFLEKMVNDVSTKNPDMWPISFAEKDKAQIIALEIAKKEKITATQEEIDAEVIKLMMHIPKEDMLNGKIDENRIKAYASQIVINEKMFNFLDL